MDAVSASVRRADFCSAEFALLYQCMKRKRFHVFLACCAILLLGVCVSCEDFWHVPITSISVTPPAPSLLTGATQQFTANATLEDGSKKVLTGPVWTTSNVAVLFINSSGVATAVTSGSATISASEEGISGSTTVTITTSPLVSIEISPQNTTVGVSKGSVQFAATGHFSDGTVKDISAGVSWTSSNTSVATISQTGVATLIRAGATTIEATSGNVSASTGLTVAP